MNGRSGGGPVGVSVTTSKIHAAAAIVSTGDELILGQTLDTNSKWLSDQLTTRGVRVVEHITLGDDQAALVATFRRLASSVDLIIMTGGLGPTADDLTRFAIAEVLGEELLEDPRGIEHLERIVKARGRTLSQSQRIQACRPKSAELIDNPNGTAPGIAASLPRAAGSSRGSGHACDLFALPGPPGELQPMFHDFVAPRLRPPPGRTIATRVLHTFGLPESEVAKRLGELMNRDANPVVGTTASGGVVSCRIRYAGTPGAAELAIADTEQRIRGIMDPFVFGAGDDSLPSVIVDLLRARRHRLIVAESCTGGLLGSMVTAVPGSSDVFLGGWITYANEMKRSQVNVAPELLAQHGAVSEPVARAMAEGALRASRSGGASADHAVALTGVAGPGGGTAQKPVGDVFIALASRRESRAGPASGSDIHTDVRRFRFPGDRSIIRDRAAKFAMAMLRFELVLAADQMRPRLLWEVALDGTAAIS